MTTAQRRASGIVGRAPRVDIHKGQLCDVEGCGKLCRALSRFCATHASAYYRTRNPQGRLPRKKELNQYRDAARYGLEHYGLATHPAIIAAERTLEAMVANHAEMPKPFDAHFRRLHECGVGGRAMLLSILSVYGLQELGVRNVFKDPAVFFTSLGSRLLRTAPLGWTQTSSGRLEQVRLPGLDAEAVGRAVAEKMSALPLLFWRRYEKEAADRSTQLGSVRSALEAHPL